MISDWELQLSGLLSKTVIHQQDFSRRHDLFFFGMF
eukprot:UN10362